MKKSGPLALIALLGISLVCALLFWNPAAVKTPAHQALGLAEAPIGGGFVLESYRGPVALEDFRGKVVALYFGYTWCPDICPTSLGFLSAALSELTPEELDRFQGLFVSVDPARDSVERLKEYGEYFHAGILGITGTPEQLAKVAHQYGAAYRIVQQDSAAGYLVDHSADLYFLDQQGRLVHTLPHGTPPDEVLALLRTMLQQSG